jgi:hypothetical protein
MLAVAAVLGLIPAAIARSKGHSFGAWWFYGWWLFIFALVHAIVLKPIGRKCPHCAEIVKEEARICYHCDRDLTDPNDKELHSLIRALERDRNRS